MNKHQLHHFWKRFRLIKPWYFLAAGLLCAVVCVFALRANSEHMAELRDTVYAADKDNGDVETALRNLQQYVTTHMNTGLSVDNGVYPPIQLQYTYQRLVEQQGSLLKANNGDLYTEAQTYCQAQNSTDFSGRNRVPCIQQYVEEHGSKTSLTDQVPDSLYKFDFVAAKWSPDLAGWSMVLTVLFFLLATVTYMLDWRIKKRLQ